MRSRLTFGDHSALAKTAERLGLNLKAKPTYLHPDILKKIKKLRGRFLPPMPAPVIFNNHYETSLTLFGVRQIKETAQLVEESLGLTLGNFSELSTLDFYVRIPEIKCTQRDRWYFINEVAKSHRVITDDCGWQNGEEMPVFKVNKKDILAQPRLVMLTREDGVNCRSAKENFYTAHGTGRRGIPIAVYKPQVFKIYLGSPWEHRLTTDGRQNCTKNHLVVGMGPYCAVIVQEAYYLNFQKPQKPSLVWQALQKMLVGRYSPGECFLSLGGQMDKPAFRIEVEFKGEVYDGPAQKAITEIVSTLDRKNIEFSVDMRKVKLK